MGRRGFVVAMCAVALLAAALTGPAAAQAFEPVSSFGSDGEGAGQLSAPGGIATGPEGNFYVVDQGNRRVDVFSSGGGFLYAFGKGVRPGGGDVCDEGSGCLAGLGGASAGALSRPEGIAVSSSGDVYVAEEGNDRVSAFSRSGAFMFAFGYRVDPAGGNVCTADSGCQAGTNLRVPENSELFSQEGPEGALGEPTGVAVAASGDVFVAEGQNNRVSAFGPLGEFLYMFGEEVEGKAPFGPVCSTECIAGFGVFVAGAMEEPTGIASLPGDSLAISDAGNHRVDVFATDGEFISASGLGVDPAGGDVCTAVTGCQAGGTEGAGALAVPAGLAASPTGAITVGDPGLERVSQFNPEGEFVRAFGAGVATGANAFQICTALGGCLPGLQSTVPGATSFPFGVAEACGGSVFVTESTTGLSRVERFGEAGTASICPPPAKKVPSVVSVQAVPTNLFQLGRLRRDRLHGTATLLVSVPGAGRVSLGGHGLHRVARHPGGAATVAIPLRLVGKPRRALFTAGHRQVVATITFTPDGGTARTAIKRLTLVKSPRRKTRRHH